MKNIFFLFLGTFLFFNASSQQLDSTLTEHKWQGNWFPYVTEHYQYDNNSNIVESATFYWDSNLGIWENQYKNNFTNNSNGQQTLSLLYLWDSYTSLWDLNGKYEYLYSSSGKELTRIGSSWGGISWTKGVKNTNSYDANDFLVQDLTFQWESINYIWQWDSTYRTDYQNKSFGKPEVIRHLYRQPTYWEIVTIDSISYSSNNDKQVFRRFVASSPTWRKETEIRYSYDANGYLISEEKEFWQISSNLPSIKNRINYTRSSLGLILQEIYQGQDTVTQAWGDSQRITYYYASGTSIPKLSNNFDYNIFPNPAQEQLNILSNDVNLIVEIMDCQARLLFSESFHSKNIQIDISEYAPGTYFVHLQTKSYSKVIKFIKE